MEQELKDQLVEIAKKHGVALAKDLALVIAFPALKAAVAKSETKIDDVVLAALEAPLKEALEELLAKA
jgi:hypothetical protein